MLILLLRGKLYSCQQLLRALEIQLKNCYWKESIAYYIEQWLQKSNQLGEDAGPNTFFKKSGPEYLMFV